MSTVIETDRLILRKVEFKDKQDLLQLHSDQEVQKWTGESPINSFEEVERSIQSRLDDYQKYGFGRLAVILKSTSEFIGWAGLAYLEEFDTVDLGYRFHVRFWGKGYATEASKALLEYGFQKLNLIEIVAIALPDNVGSIRVMEKAGMKYHKTAPYDESTPVAIWYRLKKSEYLTMS